MLPGQHQFAATKPGFRTAIVTFTGIAGGQATYDLHPSPEIGTTPPHWRYWKHVLAGGGALAMAGGVAYLWARSDLRDYDRTVIARCPNGCDAQMLHGFSYLRDRYRTKQNVEIALFSTAGAAALVGVIGLILDQPHVRAEPDRAVVAMSPTPGGGMASVSWRF
jgi:hypothetical protein